MGLSNLALAMRMLLFVTYGEPIFSLSFSCTVKVIDTGVFLAIMFTNCMYSCVLY